MTLTLSRWMAHRPWTRIRSLGAGLLGALMLAGAPARAADPQPDPQIQIEAGMHTSARIRSVADTLGRWAITVGYDKTVRIWEISSGRLLRVIRPPHDSGDEGLLYAVALSPDGNTIAVGGLTGGTWAQGTQIYLFDRASGRLLRRISAPQRSAIDTLAFSPDGRWLAASVAARAVHVWDARTPGANPMSDGDFKERIYGLSFTRDGRLVALGHDGQMRLYRVSEGNLARLATGQAEGRRPWRAAFSPDGQRVAVGYDGEQRVDLFNGANLSLIGRADTGGLGEGSFAQVAWSLDGESLMAAGAARKQESGGARYVVRRWSGAGSGAARDFLIGAPPHTISSLAPLLSGGVLVTTVAPAWGVLHPDGRYEERRGSPMADFTGTTEELMVSSDATTVQLSFNGRSDGAFRFDLPQRRLLAGRDPSLNGPLTNGLDVRNWRNLPDPSINGKSLGLKQGESSRSLSIAADQKSFALGSIWSVYLFDSAGNRRWSQPAQNAAWHVNLAPSGRVVVLAQADGTIRWLRASDGKELLNLFVHADRSRWVLWTPTGYYDASPGGEDLIGWHINRGADQAADFFGASRFRQQFYRPDVIDLVLRTLDEGQALAQADAARGQATQQVTIQQALPPVVDLVTAAEGSFTDPAMRLQFNVRTLADAPVTGIRVRVNGQLVQTAARDLGIAQVTGPGMTTRNIDLTLPREDVQIQVFAENRNGMSTPAVLSYRYTGARPQPVPVAAAASPDAVDDRPRLYVLAIGVNVYANLPADLQLNFAAKDANDFAQAMQRQKGKLYRDVQVRVLTDQRATRDEVVGNLEWLQRQVGPRDIGMLFVAGHGLNGDDGRYYFAPHNFDRERVKVTGVADSDIKSTLNQISGKALFFIDTCHSGNVMPGRRALSNDVSGMVSELSSAENGAVVFSSATGRQYALEDPSWGNGAFTKALIEGINGAAARNGRISYKGLDVYVSDRVKELTQGRQHPVTQSPAAIPDFPIAALGTVATMGGGAAAPAPQRPPAAPVVNPAPAPAPAPVPAPVRPPPAPAPAPAPTTMPANLGPSPEDACTGRAGMAKAACVRRECEKPVFSTHPACRVG